MKIVDLTDNYIEFVCNKNDFKSYEKTCSILFEHYYTYWSKKIVDTFYNKEEVEFSKNLIISTLSKIENNFSNHNIIISDLTMILFVGMGNTNGHAFQYHNEFVVWIPVETYRNKINTEVFLAHEITHALHYKNRPDFYFNNKSEQKHISRQLITEGIATYLSKMILGITDEKALWGAYLSNDDIAKWMNDCEEQFVAIKKILRNNFESTDNNLGFFYANDKEDVLNFRCGYYIGLQLIEQIVNSHKLSPLELLKIPRVQLEKLILTLL